MKRLNYKKALAVLFWLLAIPAVAVSLAFVSARVETVIARSIDVQIENEEENFFVSANDVKSFFAQKQVPILNQEYRQIDFPMLEKSLRAHPSVENAEVAATLNGVVKVTVKQRTPVLRVINKNGESYYIDELGTIMPLDESYTAKVPVATGELDEPYARRSQVSIAEIAKNQTYSKLSYLDDLFNIATYIRKDSLLSVLVHQLNVNAEGDIEFFPAVGGHRVILGDGKDLSLKFNKLRLFYKEGLNKTNGWSKYSTINLKYKNLVVCTKKKYGK